VLIVEDNDINRMVVGEMLRSAGHKVSEAHNGQEGVAVAENELFDLIFMDISMPGIDGIETTRRIRAGAGVNAETPIIGLTAHVMPEVRDAVIAAGMQDCLSKPVRRNEMQSIIANYGAPGASIAVDMDCEDETGLPIIDDEVFADLAESLPPKLFHETLTKAVQQIDSLSERLSGLETCTDLPALAEEVHKVSGAAALIGASRLHDFLSTLEWEIRNEKLSGTASIPEKASDIFSETKGILLEYT
jgi:CheY-like chemotaxis protein/HPt (histidine-containing phosphotransfer) domain-containing protein